MWPRRSYILDPLTKLVSIIRKFQCTQVKQDDFEKIKWIMDHDTLLTYSYLNETFKIHTNASNFQLGGVKSQKNKSIAFYSRKLTDAHKGI